MKRGQLDDLNDYLAGDSPRLCVADSIYEAAGAGVFADVIYGSERPRTDDSVATAAWNTLLMREIERYAIRDGAHDPHLQMLRDSPAPNAIVFFGRRGDTLVLAEVFALRANHGKAMSELITEDRSIAFLWMVNRDGHIVAEYRRTRHR